jgi:hypothetical protein
MEYNVLIAKDPVEIIVLVNDYIKEGWIPQGGICIDGNFYYQAMVIIK